MFIRPEKLEDVKRILNAEKVHGMTVSNVSGCGNQKGLVETYRGIEFSLNLLPKIKIESIVHDEIVDSLIDKITAAIQTGKIGDGKIFVYNVEKAIRIRTNEKGEAAI